MLVEVVASVMVVVTVVFVAVAVVCVAVVEVVAVVDVRPVQPGNPSVAIAFMCPIALAQSSADPYLRVARATKVGTPPLDMKGGCIWQM